MTKKGYENKIHNPATCCNINIEVFGEKYCDISFSLYCPALISYAKLESNRSL